MYYCFVQEDILHLYDNDPLSLQIKYAKKLGVFSCCHLSRGIIVDQADSNIDLAHELVVLRATCDTMLRAIELLNFHRAKLIETDDDIFAIEHWDKLLLTKRPILATSFESVLNASFTSQIYDFLIATPRLFIKSRKKGFTVQVPSRKVLDRDMEIIDFFRKRYTNEFDELLISEALEIKADSLGTKETRHFVFNGMIANSSRMVHSVKHTVPRTLLTSAVSFIKSIAEREGFPQNYVLDVGEFKKGNETFIDIIELNPITNSLCYVNNSIFNTVIPEVEKMHEKTGMGAEYCYDAYNHPKRYIWKRYSYSRHQYNNDERFFFS